MVGWSWTGGIADVTAGIRGNLEVRGHVRHDGVIARWPVSRVGGEGGPGPLTGGRRAEAAMATWGVRSIVMMSG